jgi:predicted RNase H-like nuclease (RuvC/YqgF family)
VILALLAVAWYLFALNKTTNTSNRQLTEQKRYVERELEELYKEKKALDAEFAGMKQEKESLISKVSDYEAKIEEIVSRNETRMRDQEIEMSRLRALLSQKEKELSIKDAEINSLREALRPTNDKIKELTGKLNKVSKKLIKGGAVSLQPITVTAAPSKVSGKVLEINHDYGFLVADIGAKAGIDKGDTLFVLRDNKLLGKVVVEKTDYELCVAKMLYKSLADEVKKGDLVCN